MSRTTEQVLTDMLLDFEEITQISLSPSDFNRDEVISLYPFAGAIAALEAKMEMIEDNFHPGSSDEDGLRSHLSTLQLPSQRQASKSQGRIKLTGEDGKIVGVGSIVKRKSDGKIFVSIQDGVIAGGEIVNVFESSQTGQEYNKDTTGDEFTLVSDIDGVDKACFSTSQFLNGRNLETPGEMLQRIQEDQRRTDTGGNLVAYENFAKDASPLVVTATAIRHPRGLSTVDTIITAGTTDIDKAVNNNEAVLRIPSLELIAVVQAYIAARCPTTDNHITLAPEEEDFDTNLVLALYDELLRPSVVAGIEKVWKAFVYKAKSTQEIYPTDLEKLIDMKFGHLIKFRRVEDFSVDYFYKVPDTKILRPRDLTITEP